MPFNKKLSTFMNLFGDTPKIRVLEFLLLYRDIDHSISAIAKGAGINRITLFRIWSELESTGLIKQTRKIGNAKLFTLNFMNPYIKNVMIMFDNIMGKEKKNKF